MENTTKAELHLQDAESEAGSKPSQTEPEATNAASQPKDNWPDYPEPEPEPWEQEGADESEYGDNIRGKNIRPTLGVGGQAGGNGKPTSIRK